MERLGEERRKRRKGKRERGREGERETEKRRIYLSTLELSTNTKPDPKTQS